MIVFPNDLALILIRLGDTSSGTLKNKSGEHGVKEGEKFLVFKKGKSLSSKPHLVVTYLDNFILGERGMGAHRNVTYQL